jgi:tRNA(fMet)-specific endonuclease VapC
MSQLYLLDTNICVFYLRRRSESVTKHLEQVRAEGNEISISAVVYSELLDGTLAKNAALKHGELLKEFVERLDSIPAWDRAAVEKTALIRHTLRLAGTQISPNDSAIAGHALALGATLVTNNTSEFQRVPGLTLQD